MKLQMTGQMRLEQKMKLAPRMIQSMEILQLSILALQERIEQELNSNPVLEIDEPTSPENPDTSEYGPSPEKGASDAKVEDFGRIDNLGDDYRDYMSQTGTFRRFGGDETDSKLEAIKNTAAPQQSLNEYIIEQWRLLDTSKAIKEAGNVIIDYIDKRGYLTVRLEQLHSKDNKKFTFDDLNSALKLIQKLDPTGIGARDLRECLLIQMSQAGEDMAFEFRLVSECMDELLDNRLPDIAKKLSCSIEKINNAIERMSRLDTSPGLQIGSSQNHPVRADIIVDTSDEDSSGYSVRLADSSLPNLRINSYYSKMSQKKASDEKTKKFLMENIRSAQWIIEAIEQRKQTLLKVSKAVVKHQAKFFDKGQMYLKPLPMSKIADEVGVHLATVSRAVAGKYIQCSRGILPLRKFFSGGTEDINGNSHSWQAVRAKLQLIIDEEDKSKPLSDDRIRQKLAELGIGNIARRTVAKYRKLMNIPSTRFRKKY